MAAEVIKLYQDENVEPLQNMTRYAAIDYNLLASALADEMERRQKAEQAQKKAAKAEASVKRHGRSHPQQRGHPQDCTVFL
mgnify:CR=1 FL=1